MYDFRVYFISDNLSNLFSSTRDKNKCFLCFQAAQFILMKMKKLLSANLSLRNLLFGLKYANMLRSLFTFVYFNFSEMGTCENILCF